MFSVQPNKETIFSVKSQKLGYTRLKRARAIYARQEKSALRQNLASASNTIQIVRRIEVANTPQLRNVPHVAAPHLVAITAKM